MDVWQVSEYVLGSEYVRFLNIPGDWIYQGSDPVDTGHKLNVY